MIHGIIHDVTLLRGYIGLYDQMIEIVIEYKFDNYKITGENMEIIVIIIVIDLSMNNNCN